MQHSINFDTSVFRKITGALLCKNKSLGINWKIILLLRPSLCLVEEGKGPFNAFKNKYTS